jgi:methionine-rich copper-binding protein CopC
MHRPYTLIAIAAVALTIATAASAHSTARATEPADGATLDAPPATIRIQFKAPIRVTLLRLTDAGGDAHDVTYDGSEATAELTADPASLPSGSYTVEWRGLSQDGHPASGSFSFRIE